MNRHARHTAERGVVGFNAAQVNAIESGGESFEIKGRIGRRRRPWLAAFGALGPAEFDFAQPGEEVGVSSLGGIPDRFQQTGAAIGAPVLDAVAENLHEQWHGDLEDRGDVLIITAHARVGLDQFFFSIGNGVHGDLFSRAPESCTHDGGKRDG
jgi:hypothetical protein